MSAGGEAEAFHGSAQQRLTIVIESTELSDLAGGHAAVKLRTTRAETLALDHARGQDLLAHLPRGLTFLCGGEFLERHGGHFDVQINTVHERTADPSQIAINLERVAFARMLGIAQIAAGTGI